MSNEFDPLDELFGPDTPLDPSATFTARLEQRIARIERRPSQRNTMQNRMVPYLAVTDGRAAIDFYIEVFGAEVVEEELFEMDDGRLGHASLIVGGDAPLYVSDEFPELNVLAPVTRGGSGVGVIIHVDDADETIAAAVSAGGTLERSAVDQHGARSGWFVDPWGHRWSPTSPATGV